MSRPYERRTRFYPNPRRPFERMISLVTPLKRDQLEAYEDNLLWEAIRGAAVVLAINGWIGLEICFPTKYLNKGIEGWVKEIGLLLGRVQDPKNLYYLETVRPEVTADLRLRKIIAGTYTTLASEAVDIASYTYWKIKLEIVNSTLRGYREDMTTPKITATDTDIATEGYWGVDEYGSQDTGRALWLLSYTCKLVTPSSPSPKTLRYYEVPVVGTGTIDDAFRPELPEEIADHPRFGKVNRLAFSWGAIIPTDRKTGKPKEYTALIQIFEQPVRQDHLHPIPKCLEALEAISGVKRLRKDVFERRKKYLLEL